MQINERKVLRGLGLIFSISVVAISIFSDKGLLQLKELKKVESSLIIEIEKLKQENLEWKEKVKSLKTNRTYLESLAREELGMVKRDEISIQLVNDDSF